MEPRDGRTILAYDAGCGPCSCFRALVGFLDARRRIRFMDIGEAESSGLLKEIPKALRFQSFHVIDGQVEAAGGTTTTSGSAAVFPVVKALSLTAWRLVTRVPPIQGALRFGYSALSRLHTGCPVAQVQGSRRGP